MTLTCRCLVVGLLALSTVGAAPEPRTVGRKSDTLGVASNNWTLRPAGQLITLGECPLNARLSPDGRWLAVANCGHGVQSVQVFDTRTRELVATVPFKAPQAIFHGLAYSADSTRLFISGGPSDVVRVLPLPVPADCAPAQWPLRANPAAPVVENPENYAGKVTLPDPAKKGVTLYPIGLTVAPNGHTLWACEALGGAVAALDVTSGAVIRRIAVGGYPYEMVVNPSGSTGYVSQWGEAKVAVLDLGTGVARQQIPVGKHPTSMLLDAPANRLYVTNTHSDTVSIIDLGQEAVVGTIDLRPYRNAPPGTAPDALALSPDRGTLYVACAGDNCLAVVALNGDRTGGTVRGRIPTGWYPTGVQTTADGTLWVVSYKGLGSHQNAYPKREYVARSLIGLAQILTPPNATQLAAMDQVVRENNYVASGANARLPVGDFARSPIPKRVGDPSPIKHCVYIIKENRTYDQVFGDLSQADGDPKLCMFGRQVTPNQHHLAEEYVLLDNFYCDGSVSVDGHQWCKGAAASDSIEKGWPNNYSQRGPLFGGPVGAPAGGWLWDRAKQMKVSSKTYGGAIKPGQDLLTVDTVLGDIHKAEADNSMPQLMIVHLPNNHTFGTAKGKPTPKAMVAENDLAVGRFIAGLSRTKFWPTTTVFIVEDDAQDGPDHVDCHRSPALVVGPWVKRGVVDHTFYDQCAVVRTIGLILGLPPLTQFDAAAMPMVTLFDDTAKPAPHDVIEPTQRLDEKNALGAYGQEESDKMNFAEVDVAPWPELNRILWHSVMGRDVPYPQIQQTRVALSVRLAGDEDGDDD